MDAGSWPSYKLTLRAFVSGELINFVDLHSLMLHAKFQNHRPSGSEEDFVICSHGGHLGHVTLTIYANFHSPFLILLHIKVGFD